MSDTAAAESMLIAARGRPQLDYLPVSLFGSVMSLVGLASAWHLTARLYGVPDEIGTAIGWLAVAAFVAVALGYLVKTITAFDTVVAEFRHPIAGNLFATIFFSLVLLPIVIAPWSLMLARISWLAGAAGLVCFGWFIINRWMSDRQQMAHATPVWFLPVVGMLDIPLGLPSVDLPQLHPLMIFPLAVGFFFTVPLFTLIFTRLLFEPPIPDGLKPSLLILVAPFALGYAAYTLTIGTVDLFAEALYMLTLFMLAVLVGRLTFLSRCCPFRVSWWAIGFPLAAAAAAALRFAIARPSWPADAMALLLLSIATVVIVALLCRTLLGLARGELRTLST